MPGKNTITIDGETWDLYAPKGKKGFVVVPKLLALISEIVYAANLGNIDLAAILTDDGFNIAALSAGVLPAVAHISRSLVDQWDMISEDILPVLLCKDSEWLDTHGEPHELLKALWISLNFQIPRILGPEQWESLKKSFSEVAEEEDTTTD